MAFSADGQTLASGSADRTARLWSVADLRQLRTFDGYEHPVHAVAFSPDGSTLATYAGNVKVWQGGEGPGQPLALPGQKSTAGASASIAMSLLSLIVSARSIQLGGGPIGSPIVTAPSDVSVAITRRLPVIFSPDGKTIALLRHRVTFGGDYELLVHDLSTHTTKSTSCQCFSISFSPDGTMLAVVGQNLGGDPASADRLRLLDVSTFSWL
jgi:WD40 repeat protein